MNNFLHGLQIIAVKSAKVSVIAITVTVLLWATGFLWHWTTRDWTAMAFGYRTVFSILFKYDLAVGIGIVATILIGVAVLWGLFIAISTLGQDAAAKRHETLD